MKPWFTIDKIDSNTHIISEYRHWEETHCYLVEGNNCALLIDWIHCCLFRIAGCIVSGTMQQFKNMMFLSLTVVLKAIQIAEK